MIDRNKIIKMICILAAIVVLFSVLSKSVQQNSRTLGDYANDNPEIAYMEKEESSEEDDNNSEAIYGESIYSSSDTLTSESTGFDTMTNESSDTDSMPQEDSNTPTLIGASLNGDTVINQRFTYTEHFYYEPLSDNLRRYITGVSFPAVSVEENSGNTTADKMTDLAITYEDLSYVHILHYDFEGNVIPGELICNQAIAQDLVAIFYELYLNEYQLESVRLIDEYDGDDNASMEANNTSCFNYRVVEGSTSLSKHALGLAIDINPLYNPYITYEKDGTENTAPVSAVPYADRELSFPYKIDEKDLCYKLFTERGFIWGGNWNSCKDYQHFQKTLAK